MVVDACVYDAFLIERIFYAALVFLEMCKRRTNCDFKRNGSD